MNPHSDMPAKSSKCDTKVNQVNYFEAKRLDMVPVFVNHD